MQQEVHSIDIAEDCTPTFPPIANINGMKVAITAFSFSWYSKKPITYAPRIPPISQINNHGNLALLITNNESEDSTFSEIPLAIW